MLAVPGQQAKKDAPSSSPARDRGCSGAGRRARHPSTRRPARRQGLPSQIAQAMERVAAIGVRPVAIELREWERKTAHAAKG